MKKQLLLGAVLVLFGWQTNAQITVYPYLEDFEAGAGGWVVGGGTTTWALGAPVGGIINSAASGVNAWVTNLSGAYLNNETGFVQSPEFDLTAVPSPSIQFNLWINTESNYDGFVLQSSIDGGTTWQNVGGVEANWYNNATIWGNPGGQSIGWDGSSMLTWTSVNHALTGLGGQASVYLRMAFGSDGSVTYEGVGFDDVYVYNETCPAPTAISTNYLAPDTLIVSWTNGLSETSWNYEYGPSGFTPGSGTSGTFDSNPDTIVGVSTNMLYDIYLQADCGGGDLSIWQGPTMASTLANDEACNAVLVPVDGSTTMYSNVGATTQPGEPGSVENTVWFKAIVPASGSMAIGTCGETFDTELNVYSVTDCANFATYTDLGYADYNPWGCTGWHPAGIELCGLTPDDTIYFWVDGYFGSSGTFPLSVWDLASDAGTGSAIDECIDDTVNLWPLISGQSSNTGYWEYPSNPVGITNDSLFLTSNATVGGDLIYYILSSTCASDTAEVYINVFASSSAGDDGILTVCQNEPFDLLSGLGGTVDMGGTWYDPSNNPIGSAIVAASIPGQYNYDYITSNGVCPDDTSNVVVNVDMNCDYLNINEVIFEQITLSPNPTNGVVILTNNSSEAFNYEVLDMKGNVIFNGDKAIEAAEIAEISLTKVEVGLYLIRVYNQNANKTYRVIRQ